MNVLLAGRAMVCAGIFFSLRASMYEGGAGLGWTVVVLCGRILPSM